VKDSSGFLWIATELGINKFDGRKFYTYTPNSHNLPDNSITNIAIVSRNKLFCSTGTSGYFIFDSQQEKPEALSVQFSSFVYKSHKTKFLKGKVYIKSNASAEILVFDLEQNRITDTIALEQAKVLDFDTMNDGSLILVTDHGLKTWDAGKVSDFKLKGYDTSREVQFFQNTANAAYFSGKGMLYIYDKQKEKVTDSVRYSHADVPLNKLLVTKEGNLWFSTFFPAGVFLYETANRKLQDFSPKLAGLENAVGSVIQDDEKNIWVGTFSTGLYKISPSVFDPLPVLRNENVYYAKMHEPGKLFVGTKTGLSVIDLQTNEAQHVSIDQSNNGYIYSVVKAGSKYVVLNNRIDGIRYCKDGTKFQFIRWRSICLLNDTLALAGAWSNDVDLISLKADTVRLLKTVSLNRRDGARNRVSCFLKDSHGLIWCGTDAGLYVLSADLSTCKKIEGEVFRHRIIDMLENNGCVYIATHKGLVNYCEGKIRFTKLISNRPVDKINSICVDGQGSVFLGTLNGLFKLRPNGTDTYFDEDDGLISREINRLVYDPWSNALLIATNEGICRFNLNRFKYMVKHVPKIHFDRITSTGVIDYSSGVYHLEKRNVNLYFGSTSFSHASSITYRWTADGGAYHYIYNPSIELAAMTYGAHVIEICASNDGNHWSRPLILRLNVKTPFYETIWFFLLTGLLALVITGLFFKRRIGKIRNEAGIKAELEQKLVLLKYEALNAAINPHFIFNALNSVQHFINTNQNDEASDYLAKFGFLIRQTIENATEHFISINDEIERLRMYMDLERMRFNDGFAYEIKVDPTLNTFKKKIPNMILQPLIENSIVHGFKHIDYQGYIHLHFLRAKDELVIIIEDNGRGLVKAPNLQQASEKKKSIALENIKERIRTVPKASIRISDKSFLSNRGSGVFIEITIPIDL
jgi:ligand-binding sensor domain-containing protein